LFLALQTWIILWLGISIGFRGSGRGGGGLAELVYDATKLSPCGLPPKHEAIPAGNGGEDSSCRYRLQQRQLLRLHRPLGGDQGRAQDLSFGYSKFSRGEIFLGSLSFLRIVEEMEELKRKQSKQGRCGCVSWPARAAAPTPVKLQCGRVAL